MKLRRAYECYDVQRDELRNLRTCAVYHTYDLAAHLVREDHEPVVRLAPQSAAHALSCVAHCVERQEVLLPAIKMLNFQIVRYSRGHSPTGILS